MCDNAFCRRHLHHRAPDVASSQQHELPLSRSLGVLPLNPTRSRPIRCMSGLGKPAAGRNFCCWGQRVVREARNRAAPTSRFYAEVYRSGGKTRQFVTHNFVFGFPPPANAFLMLKVHPVGRGTWCFGVIVGTLLFFFQSSIGASDFVTIGTKH